jgi:hypothetical protein
MEIMIYAMEKCLPEHFNNKEIERNEDGKALFPPIAKNTRRQYQKARQLIKKRADCHKLPTVLHIDGQLRCHFPLYDSIRKFRVIQFRTRGNGINPFATTSAKLSRTLGKLSRKTLSKYSKMFGNKNSF